MSPQVHVKLERRSLYRLINVTRQTVLAYRARAACGFTSRAVGLIGRKSMDESEGLILPSCRSIHTWFMRMDIDVVVIDQSGVVLRTLSSLPSWRFTRPIWKAYAYLELAAGAVERSGTKPGDRIELVPVQA